MLTPSAIYPSTLATTRGFLLRCSSTPSKKFGVLSGQTKNVILSGYVYDAERLERKATVVSFSKNRGKIAMFGFRAQHHKRRHISDVVQCHPVVKE